MRWITLFRTLAPFLVLASPSRAARPESWFRIQSSHFELLTDAPAKRGESAIEQLERIYRAIASFRPQEDSARRPVRVFLFKDQEEFAQYRPASNALAAGFFFPGRARDYIATGASGPDLPVILAHECVHLVLNAGGGPMPHWFAEGFSELVSSAAPRQGALEVGAPLGRHVRLLGTLSTLDLAGLLAGRAIDEPATYAKSWALVRMLTLAPAYRDRLSRFLLLVASGEAQQRAIELVYGKTLDDLERDLRASLTMRYEQWKTPALDLSEDPRVEPIGPIDAGIALADLAEDTRSSVEAERLLRELDRDARGDPAAQGKLAIARAKLAQKQGRVEDALALYSQAISLGARDPQVYFERGMLLRDSPDRAAQAGSDLRRAVELDAGFAEAWRQLALLYLRQGDYGAAIPALRTAMELKPGDASLEGSLALAVGATSLPEIPRAKDGWTNPKGDRTIRGFLVEVDCAAAEARFVIEAEGTRVVLRAPNPGNTAVEGANGGSVLLGCGPMPARAVTVEYRAGPDAEGHTAGAITSIRFE